jgi:hypothetical protein
MALPKTPKQCAIKIKSLKKQLTVMEKRKKVLAAKKKPAKKKAVKKKVVKRKAVKRKPAKKKTTKKKKRR